MPTASYHFVSPTILAVTFEVGDKLTDGKIIGYTKADGDIIYDNRVVSRDGKDLGRLVGKDDTQIHLYDTFKADPADSFFRLVSGTAPIDLESSYKITIDGRTYTPSEVFRKSSIIESASVDVFTTKFVESHTVHIKLDQPLSPGQTLKLDFQTPLLTDLNVTYVPDQIRSEAVHVSQIGFDVHDPLKVAYLSTWLGENSGVDGEKQGITYAAGTKFYVVNDDTGQRVYTGTIELSQAANNPSNFSVNYSGTDVYKMDFSSVTAAGDYHIYVEGVGTSYEFNIGEYNWQDAFEVSARGLYHQRSGIAQGGEYSDWSKPRDLSPLDGLVIKQSTATIMDTDMGLNLKNQESFQALVAGETQQIVNVSGGWHDAADWDRRIQHTDVVNDLLFLAEVRPDLVQGTNLNIPESANGIPDIIDEALWGLDFFKSLQRADGAVSGGVESSAHPNGSETSWTESLDVHAYAPDGWSSYKYAASAAKAAGAVAPYDAARAAAYLESAIRAMNWAEANTPDYADSVTEVKLARNLAAAELYKVSGDEKWNQLYLQSSSYGNDTQIEWYEHMVEAAYVYGTTTWAGVNRTIQKMGTDDIISEAEVALAQMNDDGFGTVVNPYAPITFIGNITSPETAATLFTRAHLLTGDVKWHEAMISATQFTLGANPTNMTYTTGVGINQPREIMDIDADGMGTGPRPGITIYGLYNPFEGPTWWQQFAYESMPFQWTTPVNESYIGWDAIGPLAEFTVQQGVSNATLLWGYLAGTDSGDRKIMGTAGNEIIAGTAAGEVIDGLAGNDTLNGNGGRDLMRLGDGNDTGTGGSADDTILGGNGNDTLYGQGGTDQLVGDAGDDKLYGGDARDMLSGGDGVDWLFSGTGNDMLNGGAGLDHLWGGLGADALVGGAGADYARYDDANYGNLSLRLDNASLNVGAVAIGDTYAEIEGLVGGAGNDVIIGNAANNFLFGSGGADYMDGRAGNDYLNGGAGADRFRFANALNATTNVDTIADFNIADDTILLENAIFTQLATTGVLSAALFKNLNLGALDANDRILYNDTTGALLYDADGSGAGAAIQFALLTGSPSVTAADFLVV
jgi:endoglucanase